MTYVIYVQYGKNKGKEREERRNSFTTHGATVAHTLSISTATPSPPPKRGAATPSPLSGRSSKSAGPSILRAQHALSMPPSPTRPHGSMGTLPTTPSPRSRNRPSADLRSSGAAGASRATTDNVTYVL